MKKFTFFLGFIILLLFNFKSVNAETWISSPYSVHNMQNGSSSILHSVNWWDIDGYGTVNGIQMVGIESQNVLFNYNQNLGSLCGSDNITFSGTIFSGTRNYLNLISGYQNVQTNITGSWINCTTTSIGNDGFSRNFTCSIPTSVSNSSWSIGLVGFTPATSDISSDNFFAITKLEYSCGFGSQINAAKDQIINNQNSNKNDIINNQNSNTQNIINNQNENQAQTNEKLDDVNNSITSDSSDTTSGSCGIICKLKGIFTGIIELPVKLTNLLIDGIKSLFIPSDMDFINNFVDSVENKLGFIAEIPSSIIEFLLSLATATWEDYTSISFPSINIFGYYFWSETTIDLTPAINIFQPYKYVTDVLCVTLVCWTLLKWWENFTGGGKA